MRLGRLALITASISASTTSSSAALFSNTAKRSVHSLLATMSSASSLFEFTVKDASGASVKLDKYKDKKVIMVVNVASQCGFTPQYKELQALQDKYGEQGFMVLAFPCNQFGGQEPGSASEVCTLMKDKFKVTFPIMDKVEVNGQNAAPVFTYLKEKQGGFITNAIKWNFSKFLVKNGIPIKRYGPHEPPNKAEADIVEALK